MQQLILYNIGQLNEVFNGCNETILRGNVLNWKQHIKTQHTYFAAENVVSWIR